MAAPKKKPSAKSLALGSLKEREAKIAKAVEASVNLFGPGSAGTLLGKHALKSLPEPQRKPMPMRETNYKWLVYVEGKVQEKSVKAPNRTVALKKMRKLFKDVDGVVTLAKEGLSKQA